MGKALTEDQYDMLLNTIALGQKRIQELEGALREIAEHPHIGEAGKSCTPHLYVHSGPMTNTHFYRWGCTEGHRCAAEIARKCLVKKSEPEGA